MEAPTSQERLVAAVLAGGEGRRMGGVKALRPFRGAPLVAQAAALARRWTDEVVVVVREAAQVAGAVDAPLARLPDILRAANCAFLFRYRGRRGPRFRTLAVPSCHTGFVELVACVPDPALGLPPSRSRERPQPAC